MNALIYLLRASNDDIELFHKSISLVKQNINDSLNDVDIIVIHEKNMEKYYDKLNKQYPYLKFIEIEFSLPEHYSGKEVPKFFPHPTHGEGPVAWGHPGFPMGYRHMCRFFSGEIFKLDELKKYEYVMRLDNDSFLLKPVSFDIFKYMKENNLDYGFIEPAVQIDNPKVVDGLWDTCQDYFGEDIPFENGKMYYTNFEIMKLSWFRDNYMEFYKHLDKHGGIMTKRWGDAPIRYVGLNMLPCKKHGFKNIPYQHGAVYNM